MINSKKIRYCQLTTKRITTKIDTLENPELFFIAVKLIPTLFMI